MNNVQTPKSVYRRGADDGFIFGLYLSLMFVLQAISLEHNSLIASLTALILVLGVPVIIYIFLRRGYIADGRRSQFSAMWLHGICIFFFGSLLMALTAYIYLRVINPAFISHTFEILRAAYTELGTESALIIAKTIEEIQTQHLYPTAVEIAVQIIWLAVFSGSLLSMFEALIIRAIGRPRITPPPMPRQ